MNKDIQALIDELEDLEDIKGFKPYDIHTAMRVITDLQSQIAKQQKVIEAKDEDLRNIQYYNDILKDVCEDSNFSQQEKLMSISNLMQSVWDSEKALAINVDNVEE